MRRSPSGPKLVRTASQKELLALLEKVDMPRQRLSSHSDLTKFSAEEQQVADTLWSLLPSRLSSDPENLKTEMVRHVEYSLAKTRFNFNSFHAYQACALTSRDFLVEQFNDTNMVYQQKQVRRVYYLSLEFLMGRTLNNAVNNLGIQHEMTKALADLGYEFEDLREEERDAALGNGGLGRLAACFMDSLATLNYPAWGYGLRYTYGMFEQRIVNGQQVELPDCWLTYGNPWEIQRLDIQYPVRFYGSIVQKRAGEAEFEWTGGETVMAVAYDTPIPGYGTRTTLNLRLWAAMPTHEFDMTEFNQGNYQGSVAARQRSENITRVLYPNDNTFLGKELRLRQQYLLVAATLADVVNRFKHTKRPLTELHQLVGIQLNDTHPALGIPELMRILVDLEGLEWDAAWGVVNKVFFYTNHTVLPEALEKWSVALVEHLLPRHMMIIYEINARHLQEVEKFFPGNIEVMEQLSIIEEQPEKKVRMAHMAVVGSAYVNGVAAIHSGLVKKKVFPKFYQMWPEKFQNKTNGVTPRRWLHQANVGLSHVITRLLSSDQWVVDLNQLAGLRPYANDKKVQRDFKTVKESNKRRLAAFVLEATGVALDPNSLFDIHVKRIHEYKRQLLNVLSVIHRYQTIIAATDKEKEEIVPRSVIFAGKAAPGYFMAKRIIRLINAVAAVINNDARVGSLLKLVFIPNYNVKLAELIVPASDLSQHISTAGTEASGTSNMKFALNGGLIIGTLDGANIEIREECGEETMFIFGLKTEEIDGARALMRCGRTPRDARFHEVLNMIKAGTFDCVIPEDTETGPFKPILDSLGNGSDFYLIEHDFPSYLEAQAEVDAVWQDQAEWYRRSILTTAGMGKFSSDNTINQYAQEIWKIEPCSLDV